VRRTGNLGIVASLSSGHASRRFGAAPSSGTKSWRDGISAEDLYDIARAHDQSAHQKHLMIRASSKPI
jgi:hypothetical protein